MGCFDLKRAMEVAQVLNERTPNSEVTGSNLVKFFQDYRLLKLLVNFVINCSSSQGLV